ncbi:sigma 54-interacting transcriptional regulator [Aneurinibacillus sp. Ricciae_BoGa-3]|uniref:sigma-54 interaction domain-containing protein n=1 Tax=Aneurinibacillus sp. Ricciae_BoGa-3 TaxID=3022697 RepID=UPI00233FD94E|nr:sigma 54-interacting transcriptional regulator [Aneurinibacillus sp. Ricciae_BoGa-3]WCK56545.1 sigma 54-interacting transcriptional regulator [Aneurinibacillus sp. Ricciae_BoGa-3]
MEPFVFRSKKMELVFNQAKRVAAFPSTVLIEGETGAGKEVVASYIHEQSPRSNMPFIKINCGAIPETLLESELFGYEKGAFTGAKREGNPGLFELADKGTLLLDEVSELPMTMQVKLLRVLQEREVRRVGGSWSKSVDVRILASSNRNLKEEVVSGRFRKDLYFRLKVAHLSVPPLRERPEDVSGLLAYFLEKVCTDFSFTRRFSTEVWEQLLHYSYPGNVRELRNIVEGLCVLADGQEITSDHAAHYLEGLEGTGTHPATLQQYLDQTEERVLREAMSKHRSIRDTALALGISHTTLLRKLQKYAISSKHGTGQAEQV